MGPIYPVQPFSTAKCPVPIWIPMIRRIPTPAALDPHATTAAAQAAPTSTGRGKPPGMPWQQATNVRRSALGKDAIILWKKGMKNGESQAVDMVCSYRSRYLDIFSPIWGICCKHPATSGIKLPFLQLKMR